MSKVRWDLYSAADGKPLAGSDGVAAASEEYPNDTRYAATQRRAFVRGFAQGRGAGRAVQDDELPTVEALVPALAYALTRADLPTSMESSRDYAVRLAPLVLESGYLRAAPPLHDPQEASRDQP